MDSCACGLTCAKMPVLLIAMNHLGLLLSNQKPRHSALTFHTCYLSGLLGEGATMNKHPDSTESFKNRNKDNSDLVLTACKHKYVLSSVIIS